VALLANVTSFLPRRYIVTIKKGLEALVARNLLIFVAGDFFWYPMEGHPELRVAPEAMVAPKGIRL